MSLSPQSQLIVRNKAQFDSGNWLIINADDAGLFNAIEDVSLTALHQYFDVFSQATGRTHALSFDSDDIVAADSFAVEQEVNNHRHVFAPALQGAGFSDVLIFMPKAKPQLVMLIAMATTLCGTNQRIHLVGENRGGIKSAGKLLSPYGVVSKLDSARHCSWLTCELTRSEDSFALRDWAAISTYSRNSTKWQVYSLPGVFSHKSLDAGTAMLLDALPSKLGSTVLDFACGAGVIASYVYSTYKVSKVDALDISALALFSCAHTLQLNAQRATLIAADTLRGVSHTYRAIVSNPPFHSGIKTNYQISEDFIHQAKQHLTPRGQLILVANRFLPYADILQEAFSPPKLLAQDTRFSVHSVQS